MQVTVKYFNFASGENTDGRRIGLDSLKDFGFRFEDALDKKECFSGFHVYHVIGTEHNNPKPVMRNRDVTFHTCVLSRCEIGEQGKIMREFWSPKGLVTHAFFFYDGDVLLWRDPMVEKGQMAGPYNSVALEALVETNLHRVSMEQIQSIKSWIRHYSDIDNSIKVENLLSHSEARGSGRNGEIDNIDEMRKTMGLGDSRI